MPFYPKSSELVLALYIYTSCDIHVEFCLQVDWLYPRAGCQLVPNHIDEMISHNHLVMMIAL